MHPFVEFSIFRFPTYGLMMMAGVGAVFGLVSILCGKLFSRKRKADRMDTLLTCAIILLGAMLGAIMLRPIMKIPEVIFRWGYFSQIPISETLSYVFGEIVFYGGLIGGAAAAVIFCRKYRIPILPTLDAIAPAVPLGHAFGRVGCLMAGCCYGMEVNYDHPFAVIYPEISLAAPPGIPLLALQAIEAGSLFFISMIVVTSYVTTRTKGLCLGLYLALYSILRFNLEFFRGDPIRGLYGPFSTSQYISIAIFIISVTLICIMLRDSFSKRRNLDISDKME